MTHYQIHTVQKPDSIRLNMSVHEAASYLGVCERFVRELIAKRELRHVRLGKRIILRKIDLDAYLESKAQGVKR